MSQVAPVIGRERELAALESALDDAAAGRPAGVLLVGDPGIGKTRLMDAFAERAAGRGATHVMAAAWEDGGAPPYWLWMQVLRGLGVRADVTAGDERRWLSQILPELGDPAPAPPDTAEARFRITDAIARLLGRLAQDHPLALLLDDLHWADPPSIAVLDFLARRQGRHRLLLVGSYRGADMRAREDLTGHLAGNLRNLPRVELDGLGRDELAALVRALCDVEASGEVLDAVHAASAGNPFFATELTRLLAAEDRLHEPLRGALPAPVGVQEALARRLATLPAAVRDDLVAAAVIGTEFRVRTLADVRGVSPADQLERLDAAIAAGFVRAGRPGRLEFAHGLVRNALHAELSPSRRVQLHAAVAASLERIYAGRIEPHVAELAFHYLEAAAGGDARKAADYAERAAERSAGLQLWPQAAAHYADAIAALELVEVGAEERLRLLEGRGQALMRAGDQPAARALLDEAATLARDLGDWRRFATIALATGMWGVSDGDVDRQLVALHEEALEHLEPEREAGLVARLKAQLAVGLYWSPAAARRRALAGEAIALARSPAAADEATLAFTLDRALTATWDPASAERDLDISDELLGLAARAGHSEIELQARVWRISVEIERNDIAAFDRQLVEIDRMAAELRQPRAAVYAPLHHGIRALARGHFDEVERLAAEALELAAQAAGTAAQLAAGTQLAVVRLVQGRLGEIEPMVRSVAETQAALPVWRCALALALCELDRGPEARAELASLAADEFGVLPRDMMWVFAICMLAEVCSHLGEREHARAVAALLAPYAARNAIVPAAASIGPVARYLALATATTGEGALAERQLADALARAEGQGARAYAARILLDRVELAARGALPGAPRGTAARGEALARELGMDAIVARFRSATSGAAPARVEATPREGLLERDGDVWMLSLDGRHVRLREARGLRHLSLLLANPDVEMHALDLAAGGGGGPSVGARGEGLELRAGADAGAVLDEQAKRAYRERIAGLREDVAEADEFNDPERARRAQFELDFLQRELAAAVGLGGRDRRAAADAERARVSVTRAIRGVLRRVAEHDPVLGRALATTVRTGFFCVYRPDPERPVAWQVRA